MSEKLLEIKTSNSYSEYEIIDFVGSFHILAPLARIYTPENDPVLKKIGKPACLSRMQYEDMKLHQQFYSDPDSHYHADFVDITVENSKGYAVEFAPTWDMVRNVKSNVIPRSDYMEQYIVQLNEVLPSAWIWLWEKAQAVDVLYLSCFCPALSFCHTYIMLAYVQHVMPTHFVLDNALPQWAADIFQNCV